MPSPVENPRVLVIEDDPIVSDLFSELLRVNQKEVLLVPTAEAGLELLDKESFDLVVTDKNLPGLSGLDVLEWVKSRNPDLDVIIMTAYADMDSVLRAMRQGAYDYLVKPFPSLDEVVQKIDRALEKRRILMENRRLVKDLVSANERIEALNKNLESQVEERTSELKAANIKLEELSFTDDVTTLYNQRFLFPRLEEEMRRERRYKTGLAVIMLDLDYFKRVNDTHDHLFGSRVLKRIGEIIKHSVRNVDLCVRYGGDEFCVVLPHTGKQEAATVAERIRASIEAADVGDPDESYKVTASIGIAMNGECEADSSRSLLRSADKALYLAKSAGRNCVMTAPKISVTAG
jgi:two-component system, cell cycle response regulator